MASLMSQVDEVEVKSIGGFGGDADRSGWQAGEPAGDAFAIVVEGLGGSSGPRQMARVALLTSTPIRRGCAEIAMIDPPD
jgi:hypothetical protein